MMFRSSHLIRGLVILLFALNPVHAQESDLREDESKSGGRVESLHENVSIRVLKAADIIDGFFGSQRIEDDAQKTRVSVRLDYKMIESEQDDLGASISGKISLPRLEDRWSLIIGRDDDEDRLDQPEDLDNDRSVALRFDAINSLTKNVSFDIGVRRPGDSYEVFGRARHRRTRPHKNWVSRFDNKLYYYHNYGLEYDGIFDFDRPLSKKALFRYRTRIRWWEEPSECNEGFCPEQTFIVYQRLNTPKHAMSYEFSTRFQSEPEDGSADIVDVSYFRLRYRHKSKYDWLFYEIRPQIAFRREDEYNSRLSLLLRLEALFGYKPRYDTLDFGPESQLDK
jgi:hypothetical protein